MANLIKTRRSSSNVTLGTNNPQLSNGELAWTEAGNVLFIGAYGGANNIAIGGWRVPGTLTANQAIVTNSTNMVDQVMHGNSTANIVITGTGITLANSTNTVTVVPPSTAQKAGAYYLKADGTWATVSATASPGGANTNVQYNDSTVLNGSTGFTFDETTNNVVIANTLTVTELVVSNTFTINTDILTIGNSTLNVIANSTTFRVPLGNGTNAIATPATANTLAYAGKYKAGRVLPVAMDSTGYETPIQSHLMHNPAYYLIPISNTATFSTLRLPPFSSATAGPALRALTTANTFMQASRVALTTGAGVNSIAGMTANSLSFWRGNAAGLGGFYAVMRFGSAVNVANGLCFIGFKDTITFPVANTTLGNPSAQTNIIGFGWDGAQTTLRSLQANATVCVANDLALNISTGNTNWYEGVIYAPPNGGTISYQVTNLGTGAVAVGAYNTTNLPTTTTFLTFMVYTSNKTTAAAQSVDFGGVTIEVLN